MVFKPGESGNPEGRRVENHPRHIKKLLEPHIEKALKVITDLTQSDKEHIRLKAAQEILDRCFGKAMQQANLEVTGKVELQPVLRLTRPDGSEVARVVDVTEASDNTTTAATGPGSDS